MKKLWEQFKIFLCGMANGLFGGGGGMVLMPVLLSRLKDIHKAHATAPAVIACLSAVSAAFYIMNGDVEWSSTLYVTLGATAGSALGAWLMPKIKARVLAKLFAILLIIAALRMVA